MRFSTLLFLLVALLVSYSGFAQNNQISKRTYRVTAYKAGDNTITSQSNYTDLYPVLSVYIPNTFTPNGDGINDTFGVRGEDIGQFQLMVYNRWGELIFTTSDPNTQWDGKYKGHDVQEGVYAYKYIAMGLGKGEKEKDGTVTLIR